jgi:hypothetical protein
MANNYLEFDERNDFLSVYLTKMIIIGCFFIGTNILHTLKKMCTSKKIFSKFSDLLFLVWEKTVG